MQRKTANDFAHEVMKLFDQYVHGRIDRRGFLNDASRYAVGGVSAAMLLEMLNPKFAEAQQIKTDDARIKTRYVEYPSPDGYAKMRGYLVQPWSTVEIDGFRRSDAQVAAFRFGRVKDSYAAKRGSDRNVGVIGVAVFQERGSSWPWTQRELDRRDGADAFPGRFAPARFYAEQKDLPNWPHDVAP